MQDIPLVQDFFTRRWTLYEKIVAHNYLWHGPFYRALRAHLETRRQPFSVLELGCGDARFSAQVLDGLPVSSYRGVDLSAEALQVARDNLLVLSCPVELVQGDLLSEVQGQGDAFDLVLASYSVHHLSSPEKEQLLQGLAPRLKGGGEILMLDVMRLESESRKDFLDRRWETVRRTWSALTPDEIDLVIEHEAECDFPETPGELTRMGRLAGLGEPQTLLEDPNHMARLILWSARPPAT